MPILTKLKIENCSERLASRRAVFRPWMIRWTDKTLFPKFWRDLHEWERKEKSCVFAYLVSCRGALHLLRRHWKVLNSWHALNWTQACRCSAWYSWFYHLMDARRSLIWKAQDYLDVVRAIRRTTLQEESNKSTGCARLEEGAPSTEKLTLSLDIREHFIMDSTWLLSLSGTSEDGGDRDFV